MANFKQHLLYGMGASGIAATVGYLQFGLTPVQAIASWIVGSTASLAPDIDHPEGLPGKILFEILGVFAPITCMPLISPEYQNTFRIEHWIIYFTIGYFFVRFLLAYIFKHIFDHRGIVHSLPACIIIGEIVFFWFAHLPLIQRCTIASIASIGYFSHLLADELYAVDWDDMETKRSIGSAIDIGHISQFSTWIAYAILIGLGYLIYATVQ